MTTIPLVPTALGIAVTGAAVPGSEASRDGFGAAATREFTPLMIAAGTCSGRYWTRGRMRT